MTSGRAIPWCVAASWGCASGQHAIQMVKPFKMHGTPGPGRDPHTVQYVSVGVVTALRWSSELPVDLAHEVEDGVGATAGGGPSLYDSDDAPRANSGPVQG